MSVVFLAVDEISNQKYAVKEIRPDGKEELAILRKSLEHEAEILLRTVPSWHRKVGSCGARQRWNPSDSGLYRGRYTSADSG